MSDFCTATLPSTESDLYKRVRYTTGLVLGVDEFEQEQTYVLERDRLHQRALHGYGTVHGLQVHLEPHPSSESGPEVVVTPGMAVDPHGQHICIPEAQCARLDDWLARQTPDQNGVPLAPGDPAAPISVYLVLRYRACPTDAVPLPGKPCRSLDDTMTASRLEDDFSLSFTFWRPPHVEEAVLRVFGALLHVIEGSDTGPFVDREVLLELVRRLREMRTGDTLENLLAGFSPPLGSPPSGSPPMGSPPEGWRLRIPRAEMPAIVQAMMRVWVTEVRPDVLRVDREGDPLGASYRQSGEGRCSPVPDEDDAVLLAELQFSAEATEEGLRRVPDDPTQVDVVERQRPVLLATRLLQESFAALHSEGDGEGPSALALGDLTDVEIAGTLDGTVLGWNGTDGWVPVDLPSPTTDHGTLSGLTDDDHPQYLRVDGVRPMSGDLDAGGNRVVNLDPANSDGDAVPFEQAVKTGDTASGDLGDTYPAPRVARLQGRTVGNVQPAPDQVLQWNGSAWVPGDVSAGGGSAREETELVRIVALNWRHGRASAPQLEVDGERVLGVAIAFGFGREDDEIDPAEVQAQSIHERTFQVFTEAFDRRALNQAGAWRRLRLDLDGPFGLRNVQLGPNGLITEAESSSDALVEGAYYLFDEDLVGVIPQGWLEVVVRGSFLLDEQGRAIDAEHVRGMLPTGDRPEGMETGVQGGRFVSWLTVSQQESINVNTASMNELRTLPGIGPSLAEAIVEARRFETIEELTEVRGIGDQLLRDLRDRIEV